MALKCHYKLTGIHISQIEAKNAGRVKSMIIVQPRCY